MVGMDELSLIVQSLLLLTRETYTSNGTQMLGLLRAWCNALSSFDLNVLEKPPLPCVGGEKQFVYYNGTTQGKQKQQTALSVPFFSHWSLSEHWFQGPLITGNDHSILSALYSKDTQLREQRVVTRAGKWGNLYPDLWTTSGFLGVAASLPL